MFKTRFTEMLGVEYPIQCGTMMWLSKPEFVAAVANAGVMNCIAAAIYPTGEELLEAIEQTRALTDKPFGVNVSLFPALMPRPPEEMIQTVIDSGVKILETAGRSPQPYRETISGAGMVHIHKCARIRDAVKADGLGVDIVSIVGTECGGHPSMEGVTSLILVPSAAARIKAPLIAGGGFGNGRTLVAALAMGAEAVNMGSRFMVTQECPYDQAAKDKIVETPETGTVLIMKSLGSPSRALRTRWTEKILEMEGQGATLEELVPFITGKAGLAGWQTGNVDEGVFPAGQVIGQIDDVPTVAELVQRIVAEAEETKTRLDGLA
ncbi:MAG: nitronate monooxygenase [Deltaproteobacteria bacterium]|nr:nitronate monooxygenase [Deltaproteobacteria bacterium]